MILKLALNRDIIRPVSSSRLTPSFFRRVRSKGIARVEVVTMHRRRNGQRMPFMVFLQFTPRNWKAEMNGPASGSKNAKGKKAAAKKSFFFALDFPS
jgi:hypothetical protein